MMDQQIAEAAPSARVVTDFRSIAVRAERLTLRSFAPDDAPEIFAHSLPAITRYMGWEVSPSLAAFETVWSAWMRDLAAGSEAHLVVRRGDSREFIGMAGLQFKGKPEPEVGIWIKQSAWGQGYGTEAMQALVGWAGRELGLAGVLYPVVVENWRSRSIAENLGGVVIGRRSQRKPGGVENPMVIYRIPTAA